MEKRGFCNPHEAEQVKIKAKTLVLAGEKDLVVKEETLAIAAGIPDATLRILPGEDHGSYIIHSVAIAQLIDHELR